MDRDAAVALVQSRCGKRQSNWLATEIVTELQQAQIVLENADELPWFLEGVNTSLVTVADTQTVALPATFLRLADGGLRYTDSDGYPQKVVMRDYDVLVETYKDAATGAPCYFDIIGTNIYLFPTPDAVYSLRLYGYFGDTVLTTGATENNWLNYYPDLLISEAGRQIAATFVSADYVTKFTNDFKLAFDRMIRSNVAREEAGRQRKDRN